MNKDQLGEMMWWFGQQPAKPTDDNILGLQEGLIQKLAQWGILFIGVKPYKDGVLEFLLEKGGVQFTIQWWGGSVIELKTMLDK